MDLTGFTLQVKKGEPNNFQFEIECEYKNTKWSRYRTYREFEILRNDLAKYGFIDVPILPGIDFIPGLSHQDVLLSLEKPLDKFLKELFYRPDTRCCGCTTDFVDLIPYLNDVPECPKVECVSSTPSCNPSVSDCIVLEDEHICIVGYEEKSFISKLGKFWSFIEKDIVGGLKIFKYDETKYEFVEKEEMPLTFKVRCMCYDRESRTLVLGTDSGDIERYRLNLEGDKPELEFLDKTKLHENALLSMTLHDNHYYTSGYDGNIRKVHLKTNQVVSGGKLNQRLKGNKLMTSTVVDDIMLIATTGNQILSYYMAKKVPVYISTTNVLNPCNIRTMLPCGKNLFVSHGNTFSCYTFNKAKVDMNKKPEPNKVELEEIELSTITQINSSNSNEGDFDIFVKVPATIRSAKFSPYSEESFLFSTEVYSLVNRPKSKQIIAGHEEVITIWSTVNGKMLFAWIAHKDEVNVNHNIIKIQTIYHLYLFEKGNLLLSGGSDGKIKLWSLPTDHQLTLWTPSK